MTASWFAAGIVRVEQTRQLDEEEAESWRVPAEGLGDALIRLAEHVQAPARWVSTPVAGAHLRLPPRDRSEAGLVPP
jgi:hypothetical protein